MSRSTNEWIGKTDDAAIPPRVRLRQFERDGGICQCGCNIKISARDKWETDHIDAIINGDGENRESNLQTLLAEHHKAKTKLDVKLKAKVARVRKKNLGIKKPRTMTRWRNFRGEVVTASRER